MAKLQNYNGYYCESEYEYAFLSFLEDEGWNYLAGNSIPRSSKREVLYMDDMEQFLSKTNPDLEAEEVRRIMDNVRLVGAESDFATLHKVYGWMVDGVQFTPQAGLPRMVNLIDSIIAIRQFVYEEKLITMKSSSHIRTGNLISYDTAVVNVE